MFTEYHLDKLIQAINDAEERQTQAIVAAIEKLKPKPVFRSTPKDPATSYFESLMGTPRKPTTKKKQTESKK